MDRASAQNKARAASAQRRCLRASGAAFKASGSHRIEGLDLGADDYLGKPFDLGELGARLRALVRRDGGRAEPCIRIGSLEIDPTARTVSIEDRSIDLSRREFAVLEVLARRPGHIVSRSAIEEAIYGWQEEVGSNAVEVHIHKLRAKLGADMIETVRGLGYRMKESAAL